MILTDLRAALTAAHLSQAEFAKILGVNAQTVNRWCQGTSKPPVDLSLVFGGIKWRKVVKLVQSENPNSESERKADDL